MAPKAPAEPEIVPVHREYLSIIFRRCVLALVGARVPENTTFERRMIERLVSLAEDYLLDLIAHLNRISHMQRRVTPSMDDVALLLHFNEINILDLITEVEQTPKIEEAQSVVTLNNLYFDPEEAELDSKQVPFFQKPRQLVPAPSFRPRHMPKWMPELPPVHTYMHTPSHSSQIRDLRTVRMSLVEEGRLAERALQRLLGDKGSSSVIELPRQGQATHKNSMVIVDEKTNGNGATTTGNGSGDGDVSMPDYIETAGNAAGPANTSSSAVEQPLSSQQARNGESGSTKPLRIQLHLGRIDSPKLDSPAPTPPKEDAATDSVDEPRPISLKLSLGKVRKKTADMSDLLGKRPRVDIAALARKRLEGGDDKENKVGQNDDDDHKENETEQSETSIKKEHSPAELLAAALASYSR